MTSASRKKALLGILLVVLVYVWRDGFHKMYPEAANYEEVTLPENRSASSSTAPSELVYREPKTNPFFRPTQQPASSHQQKPGSGSTGTVPLLRGDHKLIGVLGRDKLSQAVIALGEHTTVASLGDSVEAWQLITIGDNHAVFKHDTQRDTLWLYQAEH